MKPSMKYNILSLIKDKLERYPKDGSVFTKPWNLDYMRQAIVANIGNSSKYILFESYGEYPTSALEHIVDEHSRNLLIGMHFDDYFDLVQQEEPEERLLTSFSGS